MSPQKHTNPWDDAIGLVKETGPSTGGYNSSNKSPQMNNQIVHRKPSSFVPEVESSPTSLDAELRKLEQDCRYLDTLLKEIQRKLSAITLRLHQPSGDLSATCTDGYYHPLDTLISQVNDSLGAGSPLNQCMQRNSSHLDHLKQRVMEANNLKRQQAFCDRLVSDLQAHYDVSFSTSLAQLGRSYNRNFRRESCDKQQEGRDYCESFVRDWISHSDVYAPHDILKALEEKLKLLEPRLYDQRALRGLIKRRFTVIKQVIDDALNVRPAHDAEDLTVRLYDITACEQSLARSKIAHEDCYRQAEDLTGQRRRTQGSPLHQEQKQQHQSLGKEFSQQDDRAPEDTAHKRTSFCLRVFSFMALCMVCVRSCFRRSQPVTPEQPISLPLPQSTTEEQDVSPRTRLRRPRWLCPGLFSCLSRRRQSFERQGGQPQHSDCSPD